METAPLEGFGNTPKRKSQWRLSLLLVFGTLFLLAVIILPAALFIYFVPPLREQGAAALDEDDFGLGFRVGDAWDINAFDRAIKASGINVRMGIQGVSPTPYEAYWLSPDGTLSISADADNADKSTLGSVYIGPVLRKSPLILSMYYKAKKQYPEDKRRRIECLFGLVTEHVSQQNPKLKTKEDIGLWSPNRDVFRIYGRPTYSMPEVRNTSMFEYLGNRQNITFSGRSGRIDSIIISRGYDSYNFSQRADAWMKSMFQPFLNPSIKRILEQPYDSGAAKPKDDKGKSDAKS
jgi:hypothetical protein